MGNFIDITVRKVKRTIVWRCVNCNYYYSVYLTKKCPNCKSNIVMKMYQEERESFKKDGTVQKSIVRYNTGKI